MLVFRVIAWIYFILLYILGEEVQNNRSWIGFQAGQIDRHHEESAADRISIQNI